MQADAVGPNVVTVNVEVQPTQRDSLQERISSVERFVKTLFNKPVYQLNESKHRIVLDNARFTFFAVVLTKCISESNGTAGALFLVAMLVLQAVFLHFAITPILPPKKG